MIKHLLRSITLVALMLTAMLTYAQSDNQPYQVDRVANQLVIQFEDRAFAQSAQPDARLEAILTDKGYNADLLQNGIKIIVDNRKEASQLLSALREYGLSLDAKQTEQFIGATK